MRMYTPRADPTTSYCVGSARGLIRRVENMDENCWAWSITPWDAELDRWVAEGGPLTTPPPGGRQWDALSTWVLAQIKREVG